MLVAGRWAGKLDGYDAVQSQMQRYMYTVLFDMIQNKESLTKGIYNAIRECDGSGQRLEVGGSKTA